MSGTSIQFSVGRVASIACLLEVCASKPGNVHRGADFDDLTMTDFAISAEIVGQAIDTRQSESVGALVHAIAKSTSVIIQSNTTLGIALLHSPLAIVANNDDLNSKNVRKKLKDLTAEDSKLVYEAIRIANPAGLGQSQEMDVADEAPSDILSAMQFSSDQDLIARQFTNNFQQVFEEVVPLLVAGEAQFEKLTDAIVYAHISMLARYGDSLIQRKCGSEVSKQAQDRACHVLQQLVEHKDREPYFNALADLDFWMRSDGHQRNPGTTADLIVAGLFVAIINEEISPPYC